MIKPFLQNAKQNIPVPGGWDKTKNMFYRQIYLPGIGVEFIRLPAGVVRIEGEPLRTILLQQNHPSMENIYIYI